MPEITLESLKTGGLLLLNKPFKWTSFDVVNYIRKSIDVKVGHAGTLDPLATGLLILCTGKMTKQIDLYQGMEKEYTGIITVGKTTPSFDLETEISESMPIDTITDEQINDLAQQFIGVQQQIAPLYSAIKIGGERAYLKARRGETAEIKAREIEIVKFDITSINRTEDQIEVAFCIACTKGTYIRAIARDFGLRLNNIAHLSLLERTRIGDFLLTDARSLEQFKERFPVPEKHRKS